MRSALFGILVATIGFVSAAHAQPDCNEALSKIEIEVTATGYIITNTETNATRETDEAGFKNSLQELLPPGEKECANFVTPPDHSPSE